MADQSSVRPPPLPLLPVIYVAGRWQRVICALLDFSIILMVTLLLVTKIFWPQMFPNAWPELLQYSEENAGQFKLTSPPVPPEVEEGMVFGWVLLSMVAWMYFFTSEVITKGSSLGKSVFGLRVISLKRGTSPQPLEIGVRASVKAMSILLLFPLLFFINLFLMLLNKQRRSGHDILASTLVVAGQPLPEKKAG